MAQAIQADHAQHADKKEIFLSVRNLSKFFGQFQALKHIDLDVMQGEFICFLGPSGCGKTTLLRAIAGLDPQSSGTIHMKGIDVSAAPPAARDFGIVFQSYALFPNLTVADNVGYGLVNQKKLLATIKARVDEMLALVSLSEQASKYPVQLSGGQQQRVALARALATSPGLLLLDEPLSALDAQVRLRLREEIRHVQRRLGVTTIMVTHDQEEALSMAERIVVMNHGSIEQIGTPDEIYNHPRTPFVAEFVGRISFLQGVTQGNGRVAVNGQNFDCMDGRDLHNGMRVKLGIRPESIRVRGVTSQDPNSLIAKIEEMEFLGSFCRATLVASENNVKVIADFSANVVRDLNLHEGMNMIVQLPPDKLRVFADSAQG
jgi:iron(III) transport system ATP-binding protein